MAWHLLYHYVVLFLKKNRGSTMTILLTHILNTPSAARITAADILVPFSFVWVFVRQLQSILAALRKL